jgi:GNAT superfamily N-acetyltransferase
MTRDEFIATQFPALSAWIATMASAAEESSVVELDGVVAQLSPAIPEASLFNSVTYRDAAALRAALARLERTYEQSGVRAWTVWAHASDLDTAELLRGSGHVLDASPEGMGCALEELIAPEGLERLDYTEDPSASELQQVLADGYGFPFEIAARAVAHVPSGPGTIVGLARHEGAPACTVQVTVSGEDAGVYGVATVPHARSRGLARRLQYLLLARAREQGARTTSLQATAMGRPVYTALGYRSFGAMNMWERRQRIVEIDLSSLPSA